MPSPDLPPGFDFTDPDIYAERLPIDELAAHAQGGADLVERSSRRASAHSATAATGW